MSTESKNAALILSGKYFSADSERAWLRFAETNILAPCERNYRKGHQEAFWEAVEFCEVNRIEKPSWLRDALIDYAKDRVMGRPVKRRKGHPGNWARDASIFNHVNYWRIQRNERWKKPRTYSFGEAFKKVQLELEEAGEHLTIEGICAAYDRAKKHYSKTTLK